MSDTPAVQMSYWQCHKKVWANKITSIEDGSLFLDNGGYVKIDDEFANKHNPVVGGYYVVYEGGYKSFSPEKEFEDGYTIIK